MGALHSDGACPTEFGERQLIHWMDWHAVLYANRLRRPTDLQHYIVLE